MSKEQQEIGQLEVTRPRGTFTLEVTTAKRCEKAFTPKIKALKVKIKEIEDKKVITEEEKEVLKNLNLELVQVKSQAYPKFPFLNKEDCKLDRLVDFLASQKEDSENYNAWDEVQSIVEKSLRQVFQQAWFSGEDGKVDREAFFSTMESATLSERQVTPQSLLGKAMKAAANGDFVTMKLYTEQAEALARKLSESEE